jgi:hypothetical protein
MAKANERQVGGDHYHRHVLEHWDIVALFNLDYYQGQITKYIMRWKDKAGIQDLEKARHFIDKYIEVEKLRAIGELTETVLLDALKKFNDRKKEEDDDGETVDYNVSGDDPLVIEGRPGKRKNRMKCKLCTMTRESPDVCVVCGWGRDALQLQHGNPNGA